MRSFWGRQARRTGNALDENKGTIIGSAFGPVGTLIGSGFDDNGVVSDMIGGVTGRNASRDALKAQADAATKATNLGNENVKAVTGLNQPYLNAGVSSLSDLSGLNTDMGTQPQMSPFSYDKFNFEADPSYAFRKKESLDAIQNSAAASGGLFGGGTGSDLADRAGKMASEEYQNAFNRYDTNRASAFDQYKNRFDQGSTLWNQKSKNLNTRLDQLTSLAGFGNSAAGRVSDAMTGNANNQMDIATGLGDAQARKRTGDYANNRDLIMGLGNLGVKAYSAANGLK